MEYHITPEKALQHLRELNSEESAQLLELGSLTVRFYSPHGLDRQEPHTRDEVYVIASGSATFRCCGRDLRVNTGDVLTIPANYDHRFVDLTGDFATWVFVYGPEGGGGESGSAPSGELTNISLPA
jgi:Cupin domain